jgi:catechol 2,3-dioxygenase-like lactoylglutathione lyase family enzyme
VAYQGKSYLEHAAIRVKDIQWHIRFFRDVLGMDLRASEGPQDEPTQVWMIGGVQLVSDPSFAAPEGRLAHLGVMAEDQDAVIDAAAAWGVSSSPQGRHWLVLPDGLCIEVLQASKNSVAAALAVKPRG